VAPAILERELSPSKKNAVRQTVAGGALNTARLTKQLPETVSWALDFYLLSEPLDQLVTCIDPEVTTVEEWKAKARQYCAKFAELNERLQLLAS
jgi:hypothetical protein